MHDSAELHIFTVGVSILLNFGRSVYGGEFEGSGEWYRLPPDSREQVRFLSWAKRGEKVFDRVLSYVNEDPKRASAELNAFYRFIALKGRGEADVALFSTDTGTGIFCAKVIKSHLEDRGFRVREPTVVKGFGAGYDFFDEALASVMDAVAEVTRRFEGRVYLNATGGFKPETAFAAIAALLHGVRAVYYVHESFQDVVVLPAPPLQLDSKYLDMLRKIGEGRQKYILTDIHGWSETLLNELLDRQLIELKGGEVAVRRWVKPLLQG